MKIKSRDGTVIEINELQRINLQPGEKLLVTIDVSKLTPSQAYVYGASLLKDLLGVFPDNEVLIVPQTVTMQVMP
jgi:hypothetical protein